MKKIVLFLFAALFAISAVTPVYANHHRRHHRYHGGHPIVVVLPH
jgi:cell division protein FtsL